MNITNSSFLPPALFLLFTMTGTLLIQSAGYFLDTQLLLPSMGISALLSLYIVYWHIFKPTHANGLILSGILCALGILSILSTYLLDMTADGLGYQQPAAYWLMKGWNPLTKTDMLWQNIYPTATWQLGAVLGLLFGSIEAAKMYTVLWLFICIPIFTAGLQNHFGTRLHSRHRLCIVLIILSPVVLAQFLTHYVDAALYLAGITFVGGIFFLRDTSRYNSLAFGIMFCCTLFIVNAKLSGIYHAAVLCFCALAYLLIQYRKLPVKEAFVLLGGGLIAVGFCGYHPYITNLMHYGSLLPMYSGGSFSSGQKPVNIAEMNIVTGFFYSMFSATGGAPKEAALLKFPWSISAREWFFAGIPDNRSGGFGVWFGLGIICTVLYLATNIRSARQWDKSLTALAVIFVLSSIAFPQNWWLRYVPFAYAAPLLMLLAIPLPHHKAHRLLLLSIGIVFTANSTVSLISTIEFQDRTQKEFITLADKLATYPKGSVYLVPPGDDYLIYNHAHVTLTRRLEQLGVPVTVKVNAPCPNEVSSLSEFKICAEF